MNKGLANLHVYALGVTREGHLYAATRGGLFRSSSHGDQWEPKNQGLLISNVNAIAANAGNQLFAGTNGTGMFRSDDNGMNWVQLNEGITPPDLMAIVVNRSQHVFVGGAGGVFRSMNNGQSWTKFNVAGGIYALALSKMGSILA